MQDSLISSYNTLADLSTAVSSFDEDAVLKKIEQCKRGPQYSFRRACLDFSEDHQTHTQELYFSASQCTHSCLSLPPASVSPPFFLVNLSPTLLHWNCPRVCTSSFLWEGALPAAAPQLHQDSMQNNEQTNRLEI